MQCSYLKRAQYITVLCEYLYMNEHTQAGSENQNSKISLYILFISIYCAHPKAKNEEGKVIKCPKCYLSTWKRVSAWCKCYFLM